MDQEKDLGSNQGDERLWYCTDEPEHCIVKHLHALLLSFPNHDLSARTRFALMTIKLMRNAIARPFLLLMKEAVTKLLKDSALVALTSYYCDDHDLCTTPLKINFSPLSPNFIVT